MSVTLEELLESSGINALKGEEKTASDNAQQEDIVSALRKMAEAEPTPEDTKTLAAQELAEKTAEIAVIAQTLSEIEKVASAGVPKVPAGRHHKLATFIKVAMDSGYEEKEIAAFLKEAIFQRIGRAIKSGVQSTRRPIQRAAERTSDRILTSEKRLLREKLVSGSPKEVEKHLKVVKGQYGKEVLTNTLLELKRDLGHLPYQAMKELPKGAGKPSFGMTFPGGKKLSVTAENAARYGIPAGAFAGGAAISSSGKKKDSGGGVTVVKN